MNEINELKKIIDNSDNIVFFGGAGVSTASGIPDFRSKDGLYNKKYKYNPEEILSHNFFINNIKDFYEFYFDKMIYIDAKPNFCHLKLAELENKNKLKGIITQNIDNLHQMADSKNVLELHGSVYRNYCTKCNKFYDLNYMLNNKNNLVCKCGGFIKPDVVLYGEMLNENILNESINLIKNCDTLIVGGTSLNVYPAAGLINYFRGNNLILINKEKTPYDYMANLVINDDINEVFKKI